MDFLLGMWKALLHILREVPHSFWALIQLIVRRLRRFCQRREKGQQSLPCLPIPAGVWLQPDAYLYSQRYLMSLGMAVTWDNPDVQLTDMGGAVVGSHDLLPSTDYRITARIHNRSNNAPAPGMPVVFTMLSFGAGGGSTPIASDVINLPVRAAPGEPALARVVWKTPSTPGHYCIEIQAVWADDANPLDNIGQHNTQVRNVTHGQNVVLPIPVTNFLQGRGRLQARLDSYVLPDHPLTRREREPSRREREREGQKESDESFRARIVQANSPKGFPPPEAWGATLSSTEIDLRTDETTELEFRTTVPASAAVGSEQRFNVAVSEATTGQTIGGVTIILKVT
jgi:hypothetical protein